jgi:hypothetical protein
MALGGFIKISSLLLAPPSVTLLIVDVVFGASLSGNVWDLYT